MVIVLKVEVWFSSSVRCCTVSARDGVTHAVRGTGTEPPHLFFRTQRIWKFALNVTPKYNCLHAVSVSTTAWWLGEDTNVMFPWFVIRKNTKGNYLFHLIIQLSSTHLTLLRNLLLLLPTAVLFGAAWLSTPSDLWWPGVVGCRGKFEF